MIKDRDIVQFDYDGNLNGYRQWDYNFFYSFNSVNPIGVDYYVILNKKENQLDYLI